MPKMKYFNGTDFIALDAKDCETLMGKKPTDFAPSTHVGAGGASHAVATQAVAGFMSAADKMKLDGVSLTIPAAQNTFAKVKVGTVVIASDAPDDTLEFVAGSNVTITPDLTNDKVTFSVELNAIESGLVNKVNKAVIADYPPLTNLTEGMFWYNETDKKAKVLLKGEWRSVGSDGGIPLSEKASYTLPSATHNVLVPIAIKPGNVLLVFQNGNFISEPNEYILSGNTMSSTKSAWVKGTVFDFVLLSQGEGDLDEMTLGAFYSVFTAPVDGQELISIGIPGFNRRSDLLEVYSTGTAGKILHEGESWAFYDDNNIRLLGFTLRGGDKIRFRSLKKVRDKIQAQPVDGTFLVDGTITKAKLHRDVRMGPSLAGRQFFAGTVGTVVPHSLGHRNYYVTITPTQNSAGYLGEVWIEKALNSFKVCNTGTSVVEFDYTVIEM